MTSKSKGAQVAPPPFTPSDLALIDRLDAQREHDARRGRA